MLPEHNMRRIDASSSGMVSNEARPPASWRQRRRRMSKLAKALEMKQTFEIELGAYLITVIGSIGVGAALMKMMFIANGN